MTRVFIGVLIAAQVLETLPAAAAGQPVTAPAAQVAQYAADVSKTVVELQQFRHTQQQTVVGPGGRRGTATLIDLNPVLGIWYVLALDWGGGRTRYYHLENALPSVRSAAATWAYGCPQRRLGSSPWVSGRRRGT